MNAIDLALDLLLTAVASPWFYLVIIGVSALNGVFPPIPSEATVMAAAAIGATASAPHPVLLGAAAAAGAIVGDNLTYAVGRSIGTDRFRWMRGRSGRAAVARAQSGLSRRGALLILIARYIPLGRIAVNLTAGATGYPRRRFLPLTVLAGTTWAAYCVSIGSLAGHWIEDNPLLGAAAGVALAIALGLLTDTVARRVQRRREAGSDASASTTEHSCC